ncbi:MAG: gamma carbonic anhydrase family protein [Candidatus Thermoplasmatota archaeon]
MAIYEFEGRKPDISEDSYIAKSATIIGDVKIGDNCYVAPGARIKGDYGTIIIGDNSNVQENCVIHARPEEKTTIGDWVTVGHGAIIHGAEIDDYAIIGMGSIVSDEADIGRWSVVGEGAVVRSGQEIKDEEVAVGVPSKTIKKISSEYKEEWKEIKEEYASFSKRYKEGIKKID